jgi:hypothetical protein
VEVRIVEESIWEETSIKGRSLSPESSHSLSLEFAGKSPIAIVSVNNHRRRLHQHTEGEFARL